MAALFLPTLLHARGARERNADHRGARAGRRRPERQQGLERRAPALRRARLVPAGGGEGAAAQLRRPAHYAHRRGGDQVAAAPQPGDEPRRGDRAPERAGRGGGPRAEETQGDAADVLVENEAARWQAAPRPDQGTPREIRATRRLEAPLRTPAWHSAESRRRRRARRSRGRAES